MAKIATDIEQSKKLLELGLNPCTADMYYTPLNMDYPWVWEGKPLLEKDAVPAWTLSALLETMPSIQLDKFSDVYSLEYPEKFTDDCADPLDAAVEMAEWMLKKGYIHNKKGGEDEQAD